MTFLQLYPSSLITIEVMEEKASFTFKTSQKGLSPMEARDFFSRDIECLEVGKESDNFNNCIPRVETVFEQI